MVDLVAIGGSAGAIEALTTIVERLPADIRFAVLVVIHVPPRYPSQLPRILARRANVDVAHATDGESVVPGMVRIAPPDHHLVVRDGVMRLARSPRENRHRPSIDVLFRSTARWYGSAAAGVILSGGPGDGDEGLRAIAAGGGSVLVQDPADALVGALPQAALRAVSDARTGSASDLAEALIALTQHRTGNDTPLEDKQPMQQRAEPRVEDGWRPSEFACPDCTGVLWQRDDGAAIQFRCRVGHAYGPDALMDGKSEELESALWSAINTLEERSELAHRLALRSAEQGVHADTSGRYQQTADEMRRHAQQIRELLASWGDFRLEGAISSQVDQGVN